MATSPLNAMKDAPVLSATGADEDYAAKYANALEKISQTLDARTNLTPNYFNIAAGFLKPTRSGSFSESAGNASEAYGQQIERQRMEALPIAQMRAEILGKGYEVEKQRKGAQILGGIMGMEPGAAQSTLSQGTVPAGVGRLANGRQLTALTYWDPKAGAALKSGIDVEQKNMENAIKLLDSGMDQSKAMVNLSDEQKTELTNNIDAYRAILGLPGPKSGASMAPINRPMTTAPAGNQADIMDKPLRAADINNGTGIGYNGKGYTAYNTPQDWVQAQDRLSSTYLSGGLGKGVPATPENYVGMWVTGDPAKGTSVQDGAYVSAVKSELSSAGVPLNSDGTIPNTPEARRAIAIAQVKHETAPAQQAPFLKALGVNASESQGLLVKRANETPAEFNARKAKIEEPQIKDAAEIAKGLSLIDADSLTTSNTDLSELKKIANRPDAALIFAPFQGKDEDSYAQKLTKAAAQVLQTGGNLSVGNVRANLGVDLQPVYQNLKLNDDQKLAASRAENIIAQQVINNIIATKAKAFGGSRLTNYQDQQMSSLNAHMNNIPSFIGAWATRRQIDNAALMAAQDKWVDYQRNALANNQPADPRGFLLSDVYLKELPRMHKEQIEKVHKIYGSN